MIGGGLLASVIAVTELLARSGSVASELTLAVLLIIVPSANAQLTLATSVIVATALAASKVNVTVRLLPAPPQAPPVPPITAQDTKLTEAGRLSTTVTDSAASGPLFVTLIVYVRFVPVTTGFGAAVLVIARLA